MKKKMFPVLWSFRRCPFAMRARLAIQKSGQRVEIREVFLREKPESFLSLSSDGTVPILELTCGRVINESLDIMFWALRKRDPSGWLNIFHKKPDFVGNFFNELDRSFKDNLDRYKYSSRFNEGTKLHHRANGALFLFQLEKTLKKNGSLSGSKIGILDIASFPFIRQFRIADPIWFDNQPWPHLHMWLSSFQNSQEFNAIMDKYPQWKDGNTPLFFP